MAMPAASRGAEVLATASDSASNKSNWVTLLDFFPALYTFLDKGAVEGSKPTVSTRVEGDDSATEDCANVKGAKSEGPETLSINGVVGAAGEFFNAERDWAARVILSWVVLGMFNFFDGFGNRSDISETATLFCPDTLLNSDSGEGYTVAPSKSWAIETIVFPWSIVAELGL
jgi:hypothetical protein